MYVEVNSDWSDALLNALLIQCHKNKRCVIYILSN